MAGSQPVDDGRLAPVDDGPTRPQDGRLLVSGARAIGSVRPALRHRRAPPHRLAVTQRTHAPLRGEGVDDQQTTAAQQ